MIIHEYKWSKRKRATLKNNNDKSNNNKNKNNNNNNKIIIINAENLKIIYKGEAIRTKIC